MSIESDVDVNTIQKLESALAGAIRQLMHKGACPPNGISQERCVETRCENCWRLFLFADAEEAKKA